MAVSSINGVNQNSAIQRNTDVRNISSVQFGKSEPVSDEFVSNSPKKKKNKWLLWVGLAVTAVVAAIGFKKFGSAEKNTLKKSLEEATAEIKKLTKRNTELEKNIEDVISKYDKTSKELKQSKEEIMDLEDEVAKWKKEAKKARTSLSEKETECAELKKAVESYKNERNNNIGN